MACKGILKILMIIFNSAIFLAGGATVIIGVLVEISRRHVLGVLDKFKDISADFAPLANAGYLLIAVGAIIAFLGFLGCCGACCENKCMLMIFFIIILIVFVVEVVAAVVTLLYQPKVEKLLDTIRQNVAKSIRENYGQNDIITIAWNETMSLMKCCGYNNYTDFTGSLFVNRTSEYPHFCCSTRALPSEKCYSGNAALAHVEGCFNVVVKLVKKNSALLGGVAICVAAIEVAAMIVALLLYKT